MTPALGILPIPSALRSLLGSFGEGPHVNSIMNRSLHDAAGYKFVLSDEGVASLGRKKILNRGMQQRFVPDHESSVPGRRERSLSFLAGIVLTLTPSSGG